LNDIWTIVRRTSRAWSPAKIQRLCNIS